MEARSDPWRRFVIADPKLSPSPGVVLGRRGAADDDALVAFVVHARQNREQGVAVADQPAELGALLHSEHRSVFGSAVAKICET